MSSQRIDELLVLDNFQYRLDRLTKEGQKWRCIETKCPVTLLTDETKKNILRRSENEHNHERDQYLLPSSVKRKAKVDISMRPTKMVHKEVRQLTPEIREQITRKDVGLTRRNISARRRSLRPATSINIRSIRKPSKRANRYRLAVIRALPQLQKLDNIAVAQEELREAQRRGKILTNPGAPQESEEEEYIPPQQFNRYEEYTESEYSPPPRISPQRSSPPQETEYELYESGVEYHRDEASEESRDFSPPRQVSPPRHREPINRGYSPEAEVIERRKSTYERESPKQQYYEKSPSASNSFEEPTPCIENFYKEGPKMVTSQSANCIKEYTNGNDRYHGNNYRTSENGEHANQNQARDRHVCGGSHRPPFNRRPVTRNSNILSAVLCLVKELDYPSLEVVEMAVRCRMDELDE